MRSASSGTTGSYRNAWQPEQERSYSENTIPARRRSAVSRVFYGRKAMMLPMISEKEFCEHIEDDDFPIRYGNPVCIHTNDGQLLVCMTYKLYERLFERKEQVTGNEL